MRKPDEASFDHLNSDSPKDEWRQFRTAFTQLVEICPSADALERLVQGNKPVLSIFREKYPDAERGLMAAVAERNAALDSA